MPRRWYKKAKQDPAPQSMWGAMTGEGDARKCVWHTSESDPGSIRGVVDWVQQQGSQYTLVWDPTTGEVVQLLPADVGARALKNAGWFPTNRYGDVCIQICVVGRAADNPLTKGKPMKGRRKLLKWVGKWGVPRHHIKRGLVPRSRTKWKKSGHTTHLACPGNDHRDPGKVDWGWLLRP